MFFKSEPSQNASTAAAWDTLQQSVGLKVEAKRVNTQTGVKERRIHTLPIWSNLSQTPIVWSHGYAS